MKILIVQENLNQSVFKVLSAIQNIKNSQISISEIEILTYGSNCKKTLKINNQNLKSLHISCKENQSVEDISKSIANLIEQRKYSHVIASNSSAMKNLIPRVAGLLDLIPITEVISIENEETFIRPVYAGSILSKVRCISSTKIISLRLSSFPVFEEAEIVDTESSEILDISDNLGLSEFLELERSQSKRPDLGSARIVVSGGKGMGERFNALEALADMLGAAIGASRVAVDEGYAPNELQVGQTGRSVAPELYICFGISGAAQHLAGIKDSKIIAAVNKDPDAAIHNFADFSTVSDLFEVIEELKKELA